MGFLGKLFGIDDVQKSVSQRKKDQQGDRKAAKNHQRKSGSSPDSESDFDDAWSAAAGDYAEDGGEFHK